MKLADYCCSKPNDRMTDRPTSSHNLCLGGDNYYSCQAINFFNRVNCTINFFNCTLITVLTHILFVTFFNLCYICRRVTCVFWMWWFFLVCLRFGLFGYFAKWLASGTMSKWCLCRGVSLHKDQLLQDPLTFKQNIHMNCFGFFIIFLVSFSLF